LSVSLYNIADRFQAIQTLALNPDTDPQVFADTLESIEGEAQEKIVSIIGVRRGMVGQIEAAKAELERVAKYVEGLERNKTKLEEYTRAQMERMGLREVDGGIRGKVKFAKCPPSIEVEDASRVPQRLLKPQEPVVDKAAVKAEIDEYKVVPPGVKVVNDRERLKWS
jgi:hypothetical protein